MNKVLVIAPHPDDETLGCGGTLLKHQDSNDQTYWMIVTDISENIAYSKERIARREIEIEAVAKRYNFKDVFRLGYPTTTLDSVPNRELIQRISKVIYELKPHTLYVPYRNDIHTDHRAVFDAVMSSVKPFRCPSVHRVMLYETLSETEFLVRPEDGGFKPNVWIDISNYIEEKVRIMEMYSYEVAPHPFPRSRKNIEALATFRGAMAHLESAEAFMLLRQIIH